MLLRLPQLSEASKRFGRICLVVTAVVGAIAAAPVALAEDYESFQLASGFAPDPIIGTGETGGPLQAAEVTETRSTETGSCIGYIDTTPDHSITLNNNFEYLNVGVESNSEASLVIFGPNGEVWCNSGHNPSIYGEWEAGNYEVYVGNTANQGVGARYELYITEKDEIGDRGGSGLSADLAPTPVTGTDVTATAL